MKTPTKLVRLAAITLAAGFLSAAAAPALAQPEKKDDNALIPPTPAPPRNPPSHLAGMGVAIILGFLIVGVNFLPSKRGHQD